MNYPLKVCSLVLLGATLFPSCALQEQFAVRIQNLKPGKTYEVRKAVAAGDTFMPQLMTSYFFMVDSPRPPLIGAARAASHVAFHHASDFPARTAVPAYASVVGEPLSNVRTTAYCHDESDHLKYGHLNAVGTFLKYGAVRSAAADWSRYPVGTRFRIASEPGVIYEVDDYGSALVGTATIDLYRPSQGQMNDWGVRNVDIEVVQWGSFERSRHYLQGRTRYPHVRQMFYDIQRRLNDQPAASTKTTPITAMTDPSTVTMPGLSPSI